MTRTEIEAMTPKQAVAIVVRMAKESSPDFEEGMALRILLREYRLRGETLAEVSVALEAAQALEEATCSTST